MTDFQQRVRETLERLEQQRAQERGPQQTQFDVILTQFAEALNERERFVRAEIKQGLHPGMRVLVTSPRYRRNEQSYMLSFHLFNGVLRSLNNDDKTFKSAEELQEYLLKFLEESAFPRTLAIYEELCNEDVAGFLRTNGLDDMSPNDVLVRVRPPEQQRLAEARSGETIQIEVEPEGLSAAGNYDKERVYEYLSSGGFGLRITSHTPVAGGRVRLTGEVVGEEEQHRAVA